RRQHRNQSARVSGARARPRLPRLLRSAGELQLFFLRWHVLGLPTGQLVRKLLVQRAVDADRPRGCPALRPASPGQLLPPTSCVLSRVAVGLATALRWTLGQMIE